MSGNDSSTGGYLTPNDSPAPLEGDALSTFFQNMIVAITNLEPTLVRPRWQAVPVNAPAQNVDWCAMGITLRTGDDFAVEEHFSNDDVIYSSVVRHEVLTLLCSFYGPNADDNVSLLREGISLSQNRELLSLNNFGLNSIGDVTPVPALTNQLWWYRADLTLKFKRQIIRNYQVLDIASAEGTVQSDVPALASPFSVTNN